MTQELIRPNLRVADRLVVECEEHSTVPRPEFTGPEHPRAATPPQSSEAARPCAH